MESTHKLKGKFEACHYNWRWTKVNANNESVVFFHLREIEDLQHVGSSPESSQIFSTEYTRVPNPTLWTHT